MSVRFVWDNDRMLGGWSFGARLDRVPRVLRLMVWVGPFIGTVQVQW